MRYFFYFLSFTLIAFAKETSKITTEALASSTSQKDVVIIEANQRAQDFAQAYEIIKKGKSPQSILFHTSDGKIISNVIDMTPMNNGTLILFKVTTNMGNKYELIPIENLTSISEL